MLERTSNEIDGSALLPSPTFSWAKRGTGVSLTVRGRYGPAKVELTHQIIRAIGWRWPASMLEQMMLWPIGFTARKQSEMRKSRNKPRSRGES